MSVEIGVGFRINGYELLAEVGRGSYATVYRATRTSGSQDGTSTPQNDNNTITSPQHSSSPRPLTRSPIVAVKTIFRKKLNTKIKDSLNSEVRLLSALSHPHIVALHDTIDIKDYLLLVMDYCDAGDLAKFIRSGGSSTDNLHPSCVTLYPGPRGGGLNPTICRAFIVQLARALDFLRLHDVLHRDIKPQNLLLHRDPDPNQPIPLLRVADFGFARLLPQASLADTLCGSPLYMAPEILLYEKYDAKADLWSAGTVMYEMITGKPPFYAQNYVELSRKLQRLKHVSFPDEKYQDESTATNDDEAGDGSTTKEKDQSESTSSSSTTTTTATATATSSSKRRDPIANDLKSIVRSLLRVNPLQRISGQDFNECAQRLITPGLIIPSGYPLQQQDPAFARPTRYEPNRPAPNPPQSRKSSSNPSPQPDQQQQQQGQHIFFSPKYYVGSGGSDSITTLGTQTRPNNPSRRNTPPQQVKQTSQAQIQQQQSKQQQTSSTPETDSALLGKEYVMVEKSVVEVNALADELAASPRKASNAGRRTSRNLLHRPSLNSNPSSSSNNNTTANTATTNNDNSNNDDWAFSRPTSTTKPIYDLSSTPPFGKVSAPSPTSSNTTAAAPTTTGSSENSVNAAAAAINQTSSPSDSRQAAAIARAAAPFKYSPPRSSPLSAQAPQPSPTAPISSYGNVNNNNRTPSQQANKQQQQQQQQQVDSRAVAPQSTVTRAIHAATGNTPTSAAATYAFSSPLKLFSASPLATSKSKQQDPFSWYWLTHLLDRKKAREGTSIRKGNTPLSQSSYDAIDSNSNDSLEVSVIDQIEEYARKASALFDLADERLLIFLPPPPSSSEGQQTQTQTQTQHQQQQPNQYSPSQKLSSNPFTLTHTDDYSPPHALKSLVSNNNNNANNNNNNNNTTKTSNSTYVDAAEALQLYIKALAFLRKGIDLAKEFIANSKNNKPTSGDFNELVQWLRTRFNECLDKAHFAKHCCSQAKLDLSQSVQKLIYDAALKMSRTAAVDELEGAPSERCEMSYEKALWMLYALVDPIMNEPESRDITSYDNLSGDRRASGSHDFHNSNQKAVVPRHSGKGGLSDFNENDYDEDDDDEDVAVGLDSKDRDTVRKIITSIQGRLNALNRNKIDLYGGNDDESEFT